MDAPDRGGDSAAWLMDGWCTDVSPHAVALPFFPWNNNKILAV